MKKVLVITYYWPPAGGPGVQRVLRFVKYFPQFGWLPVILTVKDGDYPAVDESLQRQIPADCLVYKAATLEPYNLYRRFTGRSQKERLPTFVLSHQKNESRTDRLARWIRGNIFLPDARIGWLPQAVKNGRRIIEEEGIDLIFASSPPHTVQLIAKKLARKSSCPWVADLRDPWTEAFWADDIQKTALATRIDQALEKSVLSQADAVTTVSEGLSKMFAAKAYNRYLVLQNGFDPLPLQKIPTDRFILLFIGHLSKHQNPRTFFQAVQRLPENIKNELQIIFVGRIFKGFSDIFQRYQKMLNIDRRDYMPYEELMSFAQRASMLFRPIARTTYAASSVGAKTADYLALRKPILTLGEKKSISEKILTETDSGQLFEYEDREGMASFIEQYFNHWKKDGYVLLENQDKLGKYTVRYNVQKLTALFDKLYTKPAS